MRRVALVLALLAPLTALARDFSHGPLEAVGFTRVLFTKTSVTTGQPRPLDTYIWYPAVSGTGTSNSDGTLHDAAVRRGHWPLIVFSHGSCGFPGQSPFYTAGLASWGFVVVAPSHPGNTSAEIPHCMDTAAVTDSFANRLPDVQFIIDAMQAAGGDPASRFSRRLNPKRIGISGYSFGGQTTLRVAGAEPRVRAAVALAPATNYVAATALPIKIPTMVLSGQLDTLTPFAQDACGAFALLQGPRYVAEVLNTGHCAFTIACAPIFCGGGCEPGTLSLDEGHTLTMRYAVPFFLRYLAGKGKFRRELSAKGAPAGVRIAGVCPGA
jgi:predicted dienelactone hydrolase